MYLVDPQAGTRVGVHNKTNTPFTPTKTSLIKNSLIKLCFTKRVWIIGPFTPQRCVLAIYSHALMYIFFSCWGFFFCYLPCLARNFFLLSYFHFNGQVKCGKSAVCRVSHSFMPKRHKMLLKNTRTLSLKCKCSCILQFLSFRTPEFQITNPSVFIHEWNCQLCAKLKCSEG